MRTCVEPIACRRAPVRDDKFENLTGEIQILVVEGLAIEVTEFVCEPSPPDGPLVELRFRRTPDRTVRLSQREAMIEFQVRGILYYGLFRLVGYTVAPDHATFTYETRMPVTPVSDKR